MDRLLILVSNQENRFDRFYKDVLLFENKMTTTCSYIKDVSNECGYEQRRNLLYCLKMKFTGIKEALPLEMQVGTFYIYSVIL